MLMIYYGRHNGDLGEHEATPPPTSHENHGGAYDHKHEMNLHLDDK